MYLLFLSSIVSSQIKSFEKIQTDQSGYGTSLGNFKLTTINTRTGASQSFNKLPEDKRTYTSVDVGSGMICGMKGRHGYVGEYFIFCDC